MLILHIISINAVPRFGGSSDINSKNQYDFLIDTKELIELKHRINCILELKNEFNSR